MQNLFDKQVYEEVVRRINSLHSGMPAQWGKMNVAQMLAHCCEGFKIPLSKKPMPRMLLGILIGWMMKAKIYNDSPWKKNLPTAPNFIIRDLRNFDVEKNNLLKLVEQFFSAGPDGISKYPHPLFGKFTPEQWGKSMYKHLDHHLRQFGV